MASATSSCSVSTSLKSRLYESPHKCWSRRASISSAVIRTRSPARITEPSTTASTPNSLAISGSAFCAFLYCITEVRQITRRFTARASRLINSSVMPSAKYSWPASLEMFCSGSTASDSIFACVEETVPRSWPLFPRVGDFNTIASATATTNKAAIIRNRLPHLFSALLVKGGDSRGTSHTSAPQPLQIHRQLVRRLVPRLRLLLQTFQNHVFKGGRYFPVEGVRRLWRFMQNSLHQPRPLLIRKRTPSRCHLIQHIACGINVSARVQFLAQQLLRRHVGKCPHKLLRSALRAGGCARRQGQLQIGRAS